MKACVLKYFLDMATTNHVLGRGKIDGRADQVCAKSITVLGPLTTGGNTLPLFSFQVPAGFPSPAADHIEKHISLDCLPRLETDLPLCAFGEGINFEITSRNPSPFQ